MTFTSEIEDLGPVALPAWRGIRVMMMPFKVSNPLDTIPWASWATVVADLLDRRPPETGVGYLTIDEAEVKPGETHRRPGLHVDGIGEDGKAGSWGGGGGYAKNGMIVASSVTGCIGYPGEFEGYPGPNGDCAHLASQCETKAPVLMEAGRAYRCSPLAVHASLPMAEATRRTFVRISYPSDAPWHEGYTPSPFGVLPGGPIHPRREDFMAYRP